MAIWKAQWTSYDQKSRDRLMKEDSAHLQIKQEHQAKKKNCSVNRALKRNLREKCLLLDKQLKMANKQEFVAMITSR